MSSHAKDKTHAHDKEDDYEDDALAGLAAARTALVTHLAGVLSLPETEFVRDLEKFIDGKIASAKGGRR